LSYRVCGPSAKRDVVDFDDALLLAVEDERCWMMVDDGEKAVAVPARRLSAAKVLERNLMIDDV